MATVTMTDIFQVSTASTAPTSPSGHEYLFLAQWPVGSKLILLEMVQCKFNSLLSKCQTTTHPSVKFQVGEDQIVLTPLSDSKRTVSEYQCFFHTSMSLFVLSMFK